MTNWNDYPHQMIDTRQYQYEYNLAWMKLMTLINQNTISVQWNHHTWYFTDENEAWKFADYWGLL